MCGIAGIVNFSRKQLNITRDIQSMTQALKHRGPDGEGFLLLSAGKLICAGSNDTPQSTWESAHTYQPQKQINDVSTDATLAFGHRRLSIIDLSPAGHQPMCTPDKEVWITYNGELYNYPELREELKGKGYQFQTNTDTEVLLTAYLEWGENCLDRFNGMWAFVIYDRRKNILFGARDRFGVKPLYYYKDHDYFAFASEQKALVKLPFIKKEINPAAVFDFFLKGEIELEEESFFKGIIELFPSYSFTLNINTGDFQKRKYYSLEVNESYEAYDSQNFQHIARKTEELLINAIQIRLRSDVPLGSCLSGGIDSSAIVGITNHLLVSNNVEGKQKVFTASFKDKNVDESNWAALMVNQTKAQWHQTFPDSDALLKDLKQLIYCQDVPIWSTSTYAQYRVMQKVKENGVKVILDGQGGDELFGGYDTYNLSYWLELLNNFKLKHLTKEIASFDQFPKNISFFIKQYLRFNGLKKLPASMQMGIYKSYFKDVSYLNHDFLKSYENRLTKNEPTSNSLNATLANELHKRLKGYLKCEDRCSMWHSVESRTPFADDIHLIEHAFKTPGGYKIYNSINKHVLRESVKNFIPSEIKNRVDKKGYSTPNNLWITEMQEGFKDLFTDDLKDYINIDKLRKEYTKFFTVDKEPENGRVFKYISFAQWKQAFEL